ncbi:elongin-A [Anguilla anguilla]|uniref:elongin-A n=1 Tax=Anguilla anguilla TaxID=7936 RepID=UPI0015AE2B9A|nr:elongin-A [Anguilla anguilla]
MAEDLLGTVERLQGRISENPEPRKLLKALKRLGELPMTVDILVETGIGKSVNSLRKHDIVGEAAKTLVARWKKLVPQSVDRPSSGKEGSSRARGPEMGRKQARDPSPEERPHIQEEDEDEEEEEEREYRHSYSPSPPHHNYSPPHGHMEQEAYQVEEYDSPPREEEPPPSPPRKKNRLPKLHKDLGREQGSHSDRELERHRRHGDSAQGTSSGSEGKKRRTEREQQDGATHKSSKHSRHTAPHEGREVKTDKRRGPEGRSRERRKSPDAARGGEDEEDEAFETPTMSFESFLTYDAPTPSKKKKKPSRPSQASQPAPPAPAVNPPAPSTPSKANGTRSKRPPHDSTPQVSEKRRKVVDVVPTLPDIPLPAIQPNYRPLPSIDITPLSPQRRKVPVSCDEEDTGFTGRRFNSKMVVYSGSKAVCLPKMMSLYEQCIRVLQNNIDSIDEVGGVPYEILEPVLERCTPEQLYRIEQCNQCFMEESDELWMRHCQRDFKRESPQEYESWREMYLRLHDEREERLRMLTQNISSAHANRPRGRQVKMAFVNSVAKPPRDVRRRQEKFGTTSGASSSGLASAAAAITAPVRIRPAMSYHSQPSEAASSSRGSPPEAPRSSGGGQSSGGGHSSRDKPQVKKIAPMMAKTIKAFKNRFSRR